jgi:hypothetical protein
MSLKFQVIPALAFIAVSSPATYKATAGLLGSWVASADGLPKMSGLILHAIVFVLLATVLMRLVGKTSGYHDCPDKTYWCRFTETCNTSGSTCP